MTIGDKGGILSLQLILCLSSIICKCVYQAYISLPFFRSLCVCVYCVYVCLVSGEENSTWYTLFFAYTQKWISHIFFTPKQKGITKLFPISGEDVPKFNHGGGSQQEQKRSYKREHVVSRN